MRVVYAFIALTGYLGLYVEYTNNQQDRILLQQTKEQNDLLWELNEVQAKSCQGLHQVNKLCEETLVNFVQRLGLDRSLNPLVSTVIW